MNRSPITIPNEMTPTDIAHAVWRCVDGELPLEEERLLWNQLSQTENGWKELALAFIERRELQAGLKAALVHAKPGPGMTTATIPEAHAPVGSTSSLGKSNRGSWRAASPLMAASLMLGLCTGLWFSHKEPRVNEHGTPFAGYSAESKHSGDELDASAAARSSLASAEDLLTWMQSDQGFPAEWREELERAGRKVTEQTMLRPADFGEGRVGFVPVRRIQVGAAKSYEF